MLWLVGWAALAEARSPCAALKPKDGVDAGTVAVAGGALQAALGMAGVPTTGLAQATQLISKAASSPGSPNTLAASLHQICVMKEAGMLTAAEATAWSSQLLGITPSPPLPAPSPVPAPPPTVALPVAAPPPAPPPSPLPAASVAAPPLVGGLIQGRIPPGYSPDPLANERKLAEFYCATPGQEMYCDAYRNYLEMAAPQTHGSTAASGAVDAAARPLTPIQATALEQRNAYAQQMGYVCEPDRPQGPCDYYKQVLAAWDLSLRGQGIEP